MYPKAQQLERWLALAAAGLLLFGCFLVLRPFMVALMWAAVVCYTTWPVYQRLLRLVGGRAVPASLVMTLGLVLLLLLPFLVLGLTMTQGVRELVGALRDFVAGGVPAPPEFIGRLPLVGPKLHELWIGLSTDRERLLALLQRYMEPATKGLVALGMMVGRGALQLGLSIFIGFFLYRHGPVLAQWLRAVVDRLAGTQGRRLIDVAGGTVRAVVYGIIGTALVQGVLAGIGFAIAGVPGAGVLALATFLLSPAGGPPLIWLPAAVWLFHKGEVGWGVFMLVWGLGVSSIDNLVKPWLISQGSRMPFILIFFGVLGGVLAFGFVGVFLGPTLLAVGFRIVRDWLAERRADAG